jgi:hypothetical protein
VLAPFLFGLGEKKKAQPETAGLLVESDEATGHVTGLQEVTANSADG